jgi:hypothetical protein
MMKPEEVRIFLIYATGQGSVFLTMPPDSYVREKFTRTIVAVVRAGPVGAGVTVGEPHDQYRDRDRDHTTVIKEREPRDRTTVIKKEDADGDRSKTVIHHDN